MAEIIPLSKVAFPKPEGININMLPFMLGLPSTLPDEYHGYLELIDACRVEDAEQGKVCYLSVSEGIVPAGQTQRRPGIHTEGHPSLGWGGGGKGGWGGGAAGWRGLYMASTIPGSTRAWDVRVEDPGLMGDCEHLREQLGLGRLLDAHTLYWMTDRCPHEALPIQETKVRQWFRLVTSAVDVWYAAHSTANRLGVQPSCEIIYGGKFA